MTETVLTELPHPTWRGFANGAREGFIRFFTRKRLEILDAELRELGWVIANCKGMIKSLSASIADYREDAKGAMQQLEELELNSVSEITPEQARTLWTEIKSMPEFLGSRVSHDGSLFLQFRIIHTSDQGEKYFLGDVEVNFDVLVQYHLHADPWALVYRDGGHHKNFISVLQSARGELGLALMRLSSNGDCFLSRRFDLERDIAFSRREMERISNRLDDRNISHWVRGDFRFNFHEHSSVVGRKVRELAELEVALDNAIPPGCQIRRTHFDAATALTLSDFVEHGSIELFLHRLLAELKSCEGMTEHLRHATPVSDDNPLPGPLWAGTMSKTDALLRATYCRIGRARIDKEKSELEAAIESCEIETNNLARALREEHRKLAQATAEKRLLESTDQGNSAEEALRQFQAIRGTRGVIGVRINDYGVPVVHIRAHVPFDGKKYDVGDLEVTLESGGSAVPVVVTRQNEVAAAKPWSEHGWIEYMDSVQQKKFCFGTRSSEIKEHLKAGQFDQVVNVVADCFHYHNAVGRTDHSRSDIHALLCGTYPVFEGDHILPKRRLRRRPRRTPSVSA